MDMHVEVKEYNILGHNIRLKESDEVGSVTPDEVVDFVTSETQKLKASLPNLGDAQAAVLVALKIAQDKLTLERDFRDNIAALQKSAKDALRIVEEVVPTKH